VPVTPQRPPSPATPDDVVVTFIGHSTFLIQTPAGNVITDPVYARRASPVRFAGPRRVREPGVRFEDLPPISLVLLSHNHYDHCDRSTLRALDRRFGPQYVTPIGNGPLLRALGIARVEELDWWEAANTSPIAVTATPAQHFSARTPFDRNRALWSGFMLRIGERRIFFAGDSGYGGHFTTIGARLGQPDLSLIPIGAYEPRWFMQSIHMNPDEAVRAHLDLESRRSLGMHFGTYQMTIEGIDAPLHALERARAASGLSPEAFSTLDFGGSLSLRHP
jgi:L-ascorbate metabolism protein UlaG (beta-lactamase superfamily)